MSALVQSLFQFVALALPAVAILLQAMVSFQDKFSDVDSERAFQREFRAIEFSLLFFVVAGVVFSYSLIQSATKISTKIGLLALSIALGSLGIAAWLSFGRVRYPTENFESREEMAWSAIVYSSPIIAVSAIILGALYYYPQTMSVITPTSFEIMAVMIGLLNSLVVFRKYTTSQRRQEEAHEEVEEWREELSEFQDLLSPFKSAASGDGSLDDIEGFEQKSYELSEKLSQISENIPSHIQSEEIQQSIGQMQRAIDYIQKVHDEIQNLSQQEKALKVELEEQRNRKHELENESNIVNRQIRDKLGVDSQVDLNGYLQEKTEAAIENQDILEEKREIETALANVEAEISNIETQLNDVKAQKENYKESYQKAVESFDDALDTLLERAQMDTSDT